MSEKFPIIAHLKNSRNFIIFLCASCLVFNLNYYLMSHLAGEKDKMCLLGGNLTSFNIAFAILISVLSGLIVAGFLENLKNRNLAMSLESGSTSLFGVILGTLTAFCTLCTLPVLTVFGFSIGIGFMTEYEIYFKLASLLLLGVGFYLVNNEMIKGCKRCAV